MKVNVKNQSLNGLYEKVKNIARQFQKDTGWTLPKYKIDISTEKVTTQTIFDKEQDSYTLLIYVRKFSQYDFGVKHDDFKGLLYHEFTHMCDMEKIKYLDFTEVQKAAFLEIHAAMVAIQCLCNDFKNTTKDANQLIPNDFEYITIKEHLDLYLNEIVYMKDKTDKKSIVHTIKELQYFVGKLKYFEFNKDYNVDVKFYISKLENMFGWQFNKLYESVNIPYEPTPIAIGEADVFSKLICNSLVLSTV